MKVPPKRKGNTTTRTWWAISWHSLNESPSEKEGKYRALSITLYQLTLNESPSEKEGKYSFETMADFEAFALNESPSEKEGK